MALSLEDGNKVWQRVKIALADANPATQMAFAGLKTWLAQQKGNPQLQFVPFLSTSVDDAGGHDLGIDAACRVYAFWGKKAATATDVYLYIFDDATNDAGAGTDGRANLVFLEASKEAFAIYPSGIPIVDGVVVKAYTDFDGTTDSTDTDCPNGFVILGAA
jgi:hypothetical protein